MYVINRIFGIFSNILSAPARLIGSAGAQLRAANPLTYFRSMGRALKSLPFRIFGPLRPLFDKLGIKTAGSKLEKRNARDDLRDLFVKDNERKARRPVAQVARISQIHLMDPAGERYIVHIGSGAGRVSSQLQLYVDGMSLQLHFAQADPPDARAPVTLTAVTGRAVIRLNEAPLKLPAPIRSGDIMEIDGTPHTIELFLFDRTPVVTRVDASYSTSTGPARDQNQDAIAVGQHPAAYLFAVADGVGAGQDGDEVSAFASKYLLTAFYQNASFDLSWLDVLTTTFKHINAEVRAWLRRSPNPAGTTLTAAVIKNWTVYIAHVGDSRAYLYRQGVLQQLTQDHMQRQPLEVATVVAMEQNEPPPLRDVLTRAIGKLDEIEPQAFSLPLAPGDKLLLTSDGLTNTLRAADITTILAGNTTYAAELLVRRAVEMEAKDNVSAVVVECLTEAYVDDIWEARPDDRVFTGISRGRALKMRKPGDPITQVGPSPAGCFTFIAILAIVIIAYWILSR